MKYLIMGILIIIISLVLFKIAKFMVKVTFVLGVGILAIKYYKTTILIIAIVCLFKILQELGKRITIIFQKICVSIKIRKWIKIKPPIITENYFDYVMNESIVSLKANDKNSCEYKFDSYNIPYGRANAFLANFKKSIAVEEVYYYSAIRSSKKLEIREYGCIITNSGIYISKESSNYENLIKIEFKGLAESYMIDGILYLIYIDVLNKNRIEMRVDEKIHEISLAEINILCNKLIKINVPHALSKGKIFCNEDFEFNKRFSELTK
ncbi:MAG: hypothetical protein ACRC3Y_18705, partial [Romboutsia sp.]|uniref:hypothetical protein n=1 Tax=Romboutsia sp. TaxID=1965302 RepID=UPI003F3C387E